MARAAPRLNNSRPARASSHASHASPVSAAVSARGDKLIAVRRSSTDKPASRSRAFPPAKNRRRSTPSSRSARRQADSVAARSRRRRSTTAAATDNAAATASAASDHHHNGAGGHHDTAAGRWMSRKPASNSLTGFIGHRIVTRHQRGVFSRRTKMQRSRHRDGAPEDASLIERFSPPHAAGFVSCIPRICVSVRADFSPRLSTRPCVR